MRAPWHALSARLDRLSSGWTIAAAVALYAWYLTAVMPAQSLESQSYAGAWGGPDRHFFYTPDDLYSQVATWGAEGRRQYIDFRLGLDIGFALTYAAFLITVTGVALRKAWPDVPQRRLLLLVPLVPMACDLLENALGIALVAAYPARFPVLAWVTAGVTALKWLSLAIAHVLMLSVLVVAALRALSRHSPALAPVATIGQPSRPSGPMSTEVPADDSRPLYRFWQPRYWGIWACLGLLRLNVLLPYWLQMAEGRALGGLLYHLLRSRRRVAAANLGICFPDATPVSREALLREHFASLGMTVIEHALAWWASDALVHRLVELRGKENLDRAMAGGRGVILLTGHFGAQEFSGRAFGLSCPTTAGFYRPSRNPLIDELFKRVRKRSAPILIPKDAVRRVVRALRRGMPVWYAPDQSYRRAQSALIPFFGEPAMTSIGLSELVRLGNAVVVPLLPTRLPDGRGYRLDILPALEGFPGASPEEDARRVNGILEAHIRRVPEQYYWLHRRFKGRPEGYVDPYAG